VFDKKDITEYHAKYFAYELTKLGGGGIEKLSQSLMNATVDLNPHQVEAALFALRSPFSSGSLLADEVGLGKTIEAGLILSQLWAENRRKIIIVLPASLRKQWQIELEEKFNLPSEILESRSAAKIMKEGPISIETKNKIILCSYNFASKYALELSTVDWDLVVFDEAHKMRNSYRESSKMGQSIRWAFEGRRKLLLTATPFQNTLSKLYGLCSLIDEYFFGDFPTFRTMYATADGNIDELRTRLRTICKRTLRKDVLEFVKYTERKVETISFKPTDDEHRLYLAVTSLMQREDTYAVPKRQKHLTSVVLHKMLASSPVALASTLKKILKRLEILKEEGGTKGIDIEFDDDFFDEDLFEEIQETQEDEDNIVEAEMDIKKLDAEIEEIRDYIKWAESIGEDTKTSYLLKALDIGYRHMEKMGAQKKAVIFTESRKTQKFLIEYLERNGFSGKVISFSGTNSDLKESGVMDWWKNNYPDKITGTAAIDTRQAIVDYFKEKAEILVATEAAGEGINLQFCSLLINYDLPWNPQRVEQRIGRIHRYGQKHDVVVVNFLNSRNKTDIRVYELLRYKFNLFEGVMGASDEVIGELQNAAAFEKRLAEIYRSCRSPEEIDRKFDELQKELDEQIKSRMSETREKVLEHFDEDVHALLKINYDDALQQMDSINKKFWKVTKHVLNNRAVFDDNDLSFLLNNPPEKNIHTGKYRLNVKKDVRSKENYDESFSERVYRISHPLGVHCIKYSKECPTPPKTVTFNLSEYPAKLSVLEKIKGKRGILKLKRVVIESVDTQERLLFSARTDDNKPIDTDTVEKLFRLSAKVEDSFMIEDKVLQNIEKDSKLNKNAAIREAFEENSKFFKERREELYRWAEDVIAASERELKNIKNDLRNAEKESRQAVTVEEQKEAEEKIQKLMRAKRKAREKIFEVEDEIEIKRDKLIEKLESGLKQKVTEEDIFTIAFEIN